MNPITALWRGAGRILERRAHDALVASESIIAKGTKTERDDRGLTGQRPLNEGEIRNVRRAAWVVGLLVGSKPLPAAAKISPALPHPIAEGTVPRRLDEEIIGDVCPLVLGAPQPA